MIDDILKEIHAIKDANARKYRGGFESMMRDLRQRQEKSGRRIIQAPGHPDKDGKVAVVS